MEVDYNRNRTHVKSANVFAMVVLFTYLIVRWLHLSSIECTGVGHTLTSYYILAGLVIVAMLVSLRFVKKSEHLAVLMPGIMSFGMFSATFLNHGVLMPYFFLLIICLCALSVAYLEIKSYMIFALIPNVLMFAFFIVFPHVITGWAQTEFYSLINWAVTVLCQIALFISLRYVTNRQAYSNKAMDAFRLMLSESQITIILLDELNRVEFVSGNFVEFAKVKNMEEVAGVPLFDLIYDSHMARLFTKILRKEESYVETIRTFHDGKEHFYSIAMSMQKGIESKMLSITDITSIMKARYEAESASKSKSEFLSKMSHEIRTPLNAIMGMATIALAENRLPKESRSQVATIRKSSEYLLSITNDILDFSKIESGKMEILNTVYSLRFLVSDVVNIIKMRMDKGKDVDFYVYVQCDIPEWLIGDEIRIRQVLINILSNALKYTSSGHFSLEIYNEEKDGVKSIVATVKDTGIGIKEEDLRKLFNDFAKFDVKQNRYKEGVGLGLPITRSIINLMGGEIEVSSEYGKGSEFKITIPQVVAEYEEEVEVPENTSVLLCCQCPIMTSYVSRTLEGLNIDYSVVVDSNALINKVVEREWDYIFTDEEMLDAVSSVMSDIICKSHIVVLSDSYEIANLVNESPNFSVLITPIYSVPILNLLHQSDSSSDQEKTDGIEDFIAPDAKILLVDDLETNLSVGKGLLELFDTNVTTCISGLEAIEAVKSNKYDIVFMDHMMPEMDGVEAVRIIRGIDDGAYKDLCIVALTANTVSGAKEMFLSNGFDDFLAKPIDVDKLGKILMRWVPKEKQIEKSKASDSAETEFFATINIDGIDAYKGITYAANNVENYINVLRVFQKDGAKKIEELSNFLEESDLPSYTVAVHAIKSASASIGADEISARARELETAGKTGDMDYIGKYNETFLVELQKLLDDIETALNFYAPVFKKENLDFDQLDMLLENLKRALIEYDIVAIDELTEEIQDYTTNPEKGEDIERILRNVFVGKYKQAIELLESF